jgi:uncharacterized protein
MLRTVLRDPLYGPVALDPLARRLVDTRAFQRLRRVQQLSLASLVYPSAMHTRFEHSIGVYHLSRSILDGMARRGELAGIAADEIRLIPLAGLLHDTAQSMSAHLLEEFGMEGAEHEEMGARAFEQGELGGILAESGIPDAGRRIGEIVSGRGDSPLVGLIAGNCDADKMDYLARDAYHAGLATAFDQTYLREALSLMHDPEGGAPRVGIDVSGLGAFEAMLYAKARLFRTVYFHPTVRSAMGMLRVLLVTALDRALIDIEELADWSDSELFTVLRVRAASRMPPRFSAAVRIDELTDRILSRRLYHRAASFSFTAVRKLSPGAVLALEAEMADELGLAAGEVIVDVPAKPTMLATDLLVRMADGTVRNARDLGPRDGFALNASQEALYESAGQASVFTAEPRIVDPAQVVRRIEAAAG